MDRNQLALEQALDKLNALLKDEEISAFLEGIDLQPYCSDILSGSGTNHQLVAGPSSSSSPSSGVCKKPYSPQEAEALINGFLEYHNDGRIWKKIKLGYFKDSARTENQLKGKWRHMIDVDIRTIKDPIMKDLILRAKNVNADLSGKKPGKLALEAVERDAQVL